MCVCEKSTYNLVSSPQRERRQTRSQRFFPSQTFSFRFKRREEKKPSGRGARLERKNPGKRGWGLGWQKEVCCKIIISINSSLASLFVAPVVFCVAYARESLLRTAEILY